MPYDPQKHHRRSIRLKGYDYTQAGAYFVTICVEDRACMLGEVERGVMRLSALGQIAADFWGDTAAHFPHIRIEPFIIMPNHVHALIQIGEPSLGAGAERIPRRGIIEQAAGASGGETPPQRIGEGTGVVPTPQRIGEGTGVVPTPQPIPDLGHIIAYYKYQTTKRINALRSAQGERFWQRNYYEHIIRNETEWQRIADYIQNNPARWVADQLHPNAAPNRFNQE
jgi:REP element-mobilizing transposase RayT